MRHFKGQYAENGKEVRRAARERAGNLCLRCKSPSVPGKILTTHHFDGDKSNDVWWNLLPLCQVCHLQIQAKVDPHNPYFLPHSEWAKPYIAGFYAHKYEGKTITMEEAVARMDELLAYELLVKAPCDSTPEGEGKSFRINRAGVLAVHLMPKYHGEKLRRAVERIVKHGPEDKYEQAAVMRANEDDCGDDPLINSVRSKKS